MPGSPTEATVRRLFAVSGNRCVFHRCPVRVVTDGSITAQMCHIKARSPDGPRFDASQTEDERNAFDNLLLLCGVHHKVVDDDVETYTVERLQRLRAVQEAGADVDVPQLDDAQVRHLIETTNIEIADSVIVQANAVINSQIAGSITNVFNQQQTES